MKNIFLISGFIATILFCSCKKDKEGSGNIAVVPKDSIITTIAGTGQFGFAGDGGLATSAQFGLSSPRWVALDNAGNIYLCDASNYRIRKITPDGIIRTYAGNGTNNYSGDGGQATAASLSYMQGLTTDAAGNVYVACDGRIRKISPNGIITTVAGNNTLNLGDGGLATSASLHLPHDIKLDRDGNMIIADYGHHRVRKVNKTTGIITTIAGTGMQSFNGDGIPATSAVVQYPLAIACDTLGNIYITSDGRIRKINTAGIISTVAGGGSLKAYSGIATSIDINPVGIAFNNIGELIIADYGSSLIRKVDAAGYMTTIAGYGGYNRVLDGDKPWKAGFTWPTGIATANNGDIYIADYGAERVRKITIK